MLGLQFGKGGKQGKRRVRGWIEFGVGADDGAQVQVGKSQRHRFSGVKSS